MLPGAGNEQARNLGLRSQLRRRGWNGGRVEAQARGSEAPAARWAGVTSCDIHGAPSPTSETYLRSPRATFSLVESEAPRRGHLAHRDKAAVVGAGFFLRVVAGNTAWVTQSRPVSPDPRRSPTRMGLVRLPLAQGPQTPSARQVRANDGGELPLRARGPQLAAPPAHDSDLSSPAALGPLAFLSQPP